MRWPSGSWQPTPTRPVFPRWRAAADSPESARPHRASTSRPCSTTCSYSASRLSSLRACREVRCLAIGSLQALLETHSQVAPAPGQQPLLLPQPVPLLVPPLPLQLAQPGLAWPLLLQRSLPLLLLPLPPSPQVLPRQQAQQEAEVVASWAA